MKCTPAPTIPNSRYADDCFFTLKRKGLPHSGSLNVQIRLAKSQKICQQYKKNTEAISTMMKAPLISLILLSLAACGDTNPPAQTAASAPQKPKPLCEIDENSIAGIPLGTTLQQVQELYPQAQFSSEPDADGTEWTVIKLNNAVEVFVHTEETGKDDSPISYLETQSKACQTAEGVHPEMSVNAATQHYGAVEQIMLSEIEARQTVEFAAQPPEFSFRIDDTGIFDAKDKTYPQISTAYQDNAKIVSISVMDLPAEETLPSAASERAK